MILSPGGHTYQPKGNNFYCKPERVHKCFIKSLKMCSYQFSTLFWFLAATLKWMKCSWGNVIVLNLPPVIFPGGIIWTHVGFNKIVLRKFHYFKCEALPLNPTLVFPSPNVLLPGSRQGGDRSHCISWGPSFTKCLCRAGWCWAGALNRQRHVFGSERLQLLTRGRILFSLGRAAMGQVLGVSEQVGMLLPSLSSQKTGKSSVCQVAEQQFELQNS